MIFFRIIFPFDVYGWIHDWGKAWYQIQDSVARISLPLFVYCSLVLSLSYQKNCLLLKRLTHLYDSRRMLFSPCLSMLNSKQPFWRFQFLSLSVSASPTLLSVWFTITATRMGIPLVWRCKAWSHFVWHINSHFNSMQVILFVCFTTIWIRKDF